MADRKGIFFITTTTRRLRIMCPIHKLPWALYPVGKLPERESELIC